MNRIFPLIALLLAFALAMGYVEPTYAGNIHNLRIQIEGQTKALSAAGDYEAKEQELVEKQKGIPEANIKRLETFLPSSVNNITTILDLNALASRSNVALANVNVTPPPAITETTAQTPVGSVELTLSADASYAAFRNFLAGIEKSARILDITRLSVTGTDTGVYSYTLSLRLYWLR